MRLHVEEHGSGPPTLVLVRIDELRRLAPDALELAGLGHNLEVEDPDALVRVIEQRVL